MKKRILRLFSVALALMMLPIFSLPASAGTYVKGSNGASDSYKAGPYYDRLLSVELTGNGRTDVLAVALSQLGYQESDVSGEFSGLVGGTKNFAEYNYNFGKYNDTDGYGYYWCASFVSFCLLQARCHNYTKLTDWCRNHKGDSAYIWKELSCSQWATQLRTCGYFENSAHFDGNYIPLPGDLIFFSSNGSVESHIGLVLYSDGTSVYTVEGNTSSAAGLETNGGGVYVKSYSLSSSYIRGYGILPYKSNAETREIDYTGKNITPGLYVATTNKYVFTSETATSHTWLLPRYSMFEVTEITESGRVKATCTINGETVTGYIMNNTDRIIQLTASDAFEPYQNAKELWYHKASIIDGFRVNGSALASSPDLSALTVGDKIGIRGWIGYTTRKLSSFGYCFDGDTSTIKWESKALVTPEGAVITAGGKNALRYDLDVNTSEASAGTHTITFYVKLADGSIGELKTISYSAKNAVSRPTAPTVSSVTTDSVTLTKITGYEYRMNGGAWQTSNVFAGLSEGTPYSFTCRIAETSTSYASAESVAINVTTKITPPPETTVPEPETTVPEPETTVPQPETTVPEPETTVPMPETTLPEPETTVPEPETTAPDSETTNPPAITTWPSVITTAPDVTTDAEIGTDEEIVCTEPVTDDPSEPSSDESTEEIEPSESSDAIHSSDFSTGEPPTDDPITDAPTSDGNFGCNATTALPVLLPLCIPALVLLKKREE
ncbi:MAG: CHAP domain-containing protein [Clostridia bacterium]|nr:CHAP domain-containing protein [Clostridia bacterium]